ncbi:hypothetical protein CK203_004981 [Vitis vinifera]|uniref:Uncharacterized protein n=1 Tax=Vitis vinifera TaxID=29760 RepID=A0A438KF22_VITVI|nr:hypothetical protein CK203_004981 [Vitis vinifera]
MQPPMTTTPSSHGPSDSSDPSTIGSSSTKKRTCGQHAQKKEDWTEPNRIEMFALTHTKKDGTPVDDRSKEIMDQFQQLLTQPEEMSSSASTSSIAYTSIDEIFTQVMGPERHGHVRGYGFGLTPTSVFGSTSRRQSIGTLATKLENAQELLIVAEQKFTNAIGELSHVKETFEERLIEVQRKT